MSVFVFEWLNLLKRRWLHRGYMKVTKIKDACFVVLQCATGNRLQVTLVTRFLRKKVKHLRTRKNVKMYVTSVTCNQFLVRC